MKLLLLGFAAMALTGSPPACNKAKKLQCYKGRMEDKGMCGNYTISVVAGTLPGVQLSWTNEQSGKTYANVFRPENPCAIPESINNGDEFYFTVDAPGSSNCNQCMAFYPAPENKINIRLQQGACAGK